MAGHTHLQTYSLESEPMLLDLGEAVTELHSPDTRGTVTLVKEGGLSVVLMHLNEGAALREHSAPGPITIQVVDGHVRFNTEDTSLDAPAGHMVAFNGGVRHSVEAIQDSTLLLTLVDPERG